MAEAGLRNNASGKLLLLVLGGTAAMVLVLVFLVLGLRSNDGRNDAGDLKGPSLAETPTRAEYGTVTGRWTFALTSLDRRPEFGPESADAVSQPLFLVYETVTNDVMLVGRPLAWLAGGDLLVDFEGQVTVYNAESRRFQTLDPPLHIDAMSSVAASKDGSRLALGGVNQELLLIDMSSRSAQSMSNHLSPIAWSPDSTRLLAADTSLQRYFVVETEDPGALIELPPVNDPIGYQGWLGDSLVYSGDGEADSRRLLVVEVTEGAAAIVVDEAIAYGNTLHAPSPDGRFLALGQARSPADEASPDLVTRLFIYQLQPFQLLFEYQDLTIFSSLPVAVWTSDSSGIVAIRNSCMPDEAVVLLDIATGRAADLARPGTSQLAISPDGRTLAYAQPGLGLLQLDSPARIQLEYSVPRSPWAAANILWSQDSRFIAFTYGGYGRCP